MASKQKAGSGSCRTYKCIETTKINLNDYKIKQNTEPNTNQYNQNRAFAGNRKYCLSFKILLKTNVS